MVENSDTFDSITRALATRPGPIGLVGWGAGGGFEASVLSVPRLERAITEIYYFGDLDRAGLRIPANADRLARSAGLPPVQPATQLYDALLQRGKPKEGQEPVPVQAAETLASWLAPRHQQPAATLLHRGHRIAQEAVGLAYLLANSDAGWLDTHEHHQHDMPQRSRSPADSEGLGR